MIQETWSYKFFTCGQQYFYVSNCFLPGNREGKFPGKFGVFELPVFREIYVGIPGNFFTLARISVVLISIILTKKNALLQFKKFIFLNKNYFSKFAKLLRQNAREIKFFSSICRKN